MDANMRTERIYQRRWGPANWFRDRGQPWGEHGCPACGAVVIDVYRAGRPRIYCRAACRQRAYRARRAQGISVCGPRAATAQRGFGSHRWHALRDSRDAAADLGDEYGRHLTACGAYCRPVRPRNVTFTEFRPGLPRSCGTCAGFRPPPRTWAG